MPAQRAVLEVSVSAPDPLGPIPKKLASCIRMLLSASDSERTAAILGVQRILQTISKDKGVDVHALADRVEKVNGSLTSADKQKIQSAIDNAHAVGYAEGVRAAESKQHGTGAFRNTDGKLEWTEVALFVQREKHRLPARNHEFIDKMAARTVYGHEPTPNMHKYLHSLFYQLGGKIT
jgi:hypothetical protein